MSGTAVVILNWNGEKLLREFLPEVVRTTPPDAAKIYVADNGSSDGSVVLVHDLFPEVEVIELGHNYGFAEGYNRALARIDAEYFVLLNSDVRTSEGWLEPLITALKNDPALGAVQPKILSYNFPDHFEYAGASGGFIDSLGYPFCRGRILSYVEQDLGQYDTFRYCFWASGACMACRRELFAAVGGFDASFFAHMEEIDLCWRAQLFGFRIAVQPASVVYHVGGATLDSASPRKLFLNYRNNLFMLYKNLPIRKFRLVYVMRCILDFMTAAAYFLTLRPQLAGAILRAYREFWHSGRRLFSEQRDFIRRNTIASPTGIYKGIIPLRYIFRRLFGYMM